MGEESKAKFDKYTGYLAKAKAAYKTARGIMAGKVTAALEAQKASAAAWAAKVAKAKNAAAIAKGNWDVAVKEQTAATGANTAAVVAKRKSKYAAIDAHSVYVKFVKEGASRGMIH